jgi:hypothetical protein
MRIIWSNTLIKILFGSALVITAVGLYFQPIGDVPCSTIAHYPNRSEVFSCPAGLSTVVLRNTDSIGVYTTITTDTQTQAWLTVEGDSETLKTFPVRLGAPAILGPGAFLAVGNGRGLVYVDGKTKYLLTVVWQVKDAQNH